MLKFSKKKEVAFYRSKNLCFMLWLEIFLYQILDKNVCLKCFSFFESSTWTFGWTESWTWSEFKSWFYFETSGESVVTWPPSLYALHSNRPFESTQQALGLDNSLMFQSVRKSHTQKKKKNLKCFCVCWDSYSLTLWLWQVSQCLYFTAQVHAHTLRNKTISRWPHTWLKCSSLSSDWLQFSALWLAECDGRVQRAVLWSWLNLS